ncbi:MAG TPA: 4-hydroxy-tetrahydrodipicolinate reductase, partial [Anaeromyxobacteraceae bacterium]|nr:4-hydroxy-tetrahydrodipicolinate reductase [Anaeromyxobacteraceae bacterium]
MVNVVVTGANGRMGSQIVRLVRESEGFALHAAVERPGFPPGTDAGLPAGLGPVGVGIGDDLGKALAGADVVVDFTRPDASARNAELCAERRVPVVIGSTGFTAETRGRVEAVAKQIPVVLSPNMSVGMNVLFALVRQAATVLGEAFDVEILDIHHRKKRDAPSGTAVKLAEVAADALDREMGSSVAYVRHGILGERPPWQIGVQTLRGGDVVGDHTVFFLGEGERLELTHRATSREQFARGALRAAAWLPGRAP